MPFYLVIMKFLKLKGNGGKHYLVITGTCSNLFLLYKLCENGLITHLNFAPRLVGLW